MKRLTKGEAIQMYGPDLVKQAALGPIEIDGPSTECPGYVVCLSERVECPDGEKLRGYWLITDEDSHVEDASSIFFNDDPDYFSN